MSLFLGEEDAFRSRKRRHSQLLKLIETNPLLTDEEISSKLGVSLSTVRLDRGLLAIPELRERTRAMAEHAASRLKSLRDDEVVGELLGLEPNSWALSTLEIGPEMALPHDRYGRRLLHLRAGLLARDSDDRRGDGRLPPPRASNTASRHTSAKRSSLARRSARTRATNTW